MKSKRSRAERGRFSVRRKAEAVVRMLRGEELDALSRELGVTAATLSSWRDRFLAGGESNLKEREIDARDGEIRRLKAKVGDLMMTVELKDEEAERLKAGLPLAIRKSWQ
jgi:hypothetical protein